MSQRPLALISLFLALAYATPAAHAQDDIPVKSYDLTPSIAQPGNTVSAVIHTSLTTGGIPTSATLDLSPVGLSATTPTTVYFDVFSATFTIPTGTPAGDYSIKATIMAGSVVFATPTATLHVTTGPLLQTVAFQPASVQPGQSTTLNAVIVPGDVAVATVTADMSAFGLSAATPMTSSGTNVYTFSLNLPANEPVQNLLASVTMTDVLGRSTKASAGLQIYRNYPPILVGLSLTPPYARPGGAVKIHAGFDIQGCLLTSVTADLSAFGLSPAYPVPGDLQDRDATFTVPANQADGVYNIVLTVSDSCGQSYTVGTPLHTTRGPIITHAAYEDGTVMPGENATISATVDPGDATSVNVTADLTTFGLSATEPLTNYASPAKYYRTFVAHDPHKVYDATVVTATDTQGRSCSASAYLALESGGWPHVIALAASPQPVRPGQVETLTLTPNGFPAFGAYADLSSFGVPYSQNFGTFPLTPLSFTVPANTPPGPYRVVAWISDEGNDIQSDSLILTVSQPVLHGDVNGDGTFGIPDVLCALQIAGGFSPATSQALAAASQTSSPLANLGIADAVRLARDLRGGG